MENSFKIRKGGNSMSVNSYKEDEQSIQIGKLQTLKRLFAYLLSYKSTIAAVLVIMAFCVVVSLLNPLFIESAISCCRTESFDDRRH